jgi:hypothetical protein
MRPTNSARPLAGAHSSARAPWRAEVVDQDPEAFGRKVFCPHVPAPCGVVFLQIEMRHKLAAVRTFCQ